LPQKKAYIFALLECFFVASGDIVTRKRSRPCGETLREIIYLKSEGFVDGDDIETLEIVRNSFKV
jgi:hypothetical protein